MDLPFLDNRRNFCIKKGSTPARCLSEALAEKEIGGAPEKEGRRKVKVAEDKVLQGVKGRGKATALKKRFLLTRLSEMDRFQL